MCTIYDETNKLWMNSSYQLLSPDQEITVNLLKLLSMYGSKVAQVFPILFPIFNYLVFIIIVLGKLCSDE